MSSHPATTHQTPKLEFHSSPQFHSRKLATALSSSLYDHISFRLLSKTDGLNYKSRKHKGNLTSKYKMRSTQTFSSRFTGKVFVLVLAYKLDQNKEKSHPPRCHFKILLLLLLLTSLPVRKYSVPKHLPTIFILHPLEMFFQFQLSSLHINQVALVAAKKFNHLRQRTECFVIVYHREKSGKRKAKGNCSELHDPFSFPVELLGQNLPGTELCSLNERQYQHMNLWTQRPTPNHKLISGTIQSFITI